MSFVYNYNKQCPEQESNLHPLMRTWPSTMRVYQFRHPGLKENTKLININ